MLNVRSSLVLVAALLAACGGPSHPGSRAPVPATAQPNAAPPPAPSPPLPLDPGVLTGKLANGLTYYIIHNAQPEHRVSLWLAVKAGSVLEDEDQRGIAHFVEHMAFNGTAKYPKQALVSWLEQIGMKFGADVNARTEFDSTVYQIEVPTDKPELITHGLDVLHEWATAVAFEPDRVEKERGIILEERRLGRGVQGRLLFDQIIPGALPGSKYGQRVPIGTEAIIKSVTPETLKRFYHAWYRPDLMAVVVVGDIDPATLQKQVASQFADLVTPPGAPARPTVAIPPHDQTVVMALTDPELPITAVAVAAKLPHRQVHDERDAHRQLVELLFMQLVNQRLDEISKDPSAPFLAGVVGTLPIMNQLDVWFHVAIVKGDRVVDAMTALSTELARVARFGFVDSELARTKQDVLHRFEVKAAEKRQTAAITEDLVHMFETTDVTTSPADDLAIARRELPTITAAELQAVAALADSDHSRVVIAVANARTTLPDHPALLAAVAAGKAAATTPYVDDAANIVLVPTPPAPGTIKSERTLPAIGVTEWRLANGVRVVLKPTDFKNDQIVIGGYWFGGTSLASDADWVGASEVPGLLAATGAGTLSAVRLHKALAGTGVELGVQAHDDRMELEGVGPTDHLEQLLQLAYLRLTPPRHDDVGAVSWRAKEVVARANLLDDPQTAFEAQWQQTWFGHHPRHRVLDSNDFATVDLDRALAFYQDRVAHLGSLTIVMVGNFTIETAKPLILTYLGGLPAGKSEHWKAHPVERPAGLTKFEVKQGIEPKASVHLAFHAAVPWTREHAHDLRTIVEGLQIRLREELREGMSGVYGVRVRDTFTRVPAPEAAIEIEFTCAPDRVDALVAAALAVVDAFKTVGPAADVIEKLREAQRREREVDVRTNEFWLGRLVRSYRHGDDPTRIGTDDKLIDTISTERLRDAAKLFLPATYVLGVLKPK